MCLIHSHPFSKWNFPHFSSFISTCSRLFLFVINYSLFLSFVHFLLLFVLLIQFFSLHFSIFVLYFCLNFFYCLVMGLQRLFSATISIVGLFISVDYGLCDEFRCRGHNITVITSSSSSSLISHSLSNVSKSIEWQGHAFWTFIYLAGIALWTLHLSLLEGYIHTTPTVGTYKLEKMREWKKEKQNK